MRGLRSADARREGRRDAALGNAAAAAAARGAAAAAVCRAGFRHARPCARLRESIALRSAYELRFFLFEQKRACLRTIALQQMS